MVNVDENEIEPLINPQASVKQERVNKVENKNRNETDPLIPKPDSEQELKDFFSKLWGDPWKRFLLIFTIIALFFGLIYSLIIYGFIIEEIILKLFTVPKWVAHVATFIFFCIFIPSSILFPVYTAYFAAFIVFSKYFFPDYLDLAIEFLKDFFKADVWWKKLIIIMMVVFVILKLAFRVYSRFFGKDEDKNAKNEQAKKDEQTKKDEQAKQDEQVVVEIQ
jgi:hypothetical protein